ncbi:histidine--tRNA ligase [Tardiphaga sp. vice352]|uniref:histidine--tRNA ligase n=1 Tax=unclassified Tardiphaga TaxID=2631404 RepID=UPI001162E8A4|nr:MULTISPECIES: histidine--tRNA ligase [unclassified Tardiphaga]QDM18306.1 histidine--tRNA ligase [Tardiphaga sp. vice278]QDM23311.1 histidine--tRNA ligase [Tardiphaga sp. vice154]QDM28531.1 histidine--tRNA ligase [Tardiphaga sp. vice304]QDM33630.1 histidine--tRNA ligase [Tardiphaga sp. vice352]
MADKPKKPQKLRARLPRGLGDRGPAEIAATRRMTETIREVYERYGFEPVETPTMEFTDALGKFLPDQDRPNEGVFSFQDDDEQWISLRYDLTAPLARYVAENFDHLPKPYRSYRAGYVYRNEKPGPGRFRQFMQFDADTVGSASPAADAEMCMMAADAMEKLGLTGQYVVRVNNRKIFDGLREQLAITDDAQWLTVMRAIDKLDKFSVAEIEKLLGPGRWDGGEEGKGDFTKGAGLDGSQITRILAVTGTPGEPSGAESTVSSNAVTLANFESAVGESSIGREGISELTQIDAIASASGYDGRIVIDPSVVRGLEYYTGPVYEVELTIPTEDEKGRPVRFGSVGGGGRYDGLVSRFRGEPVPATGFSIGVSRLQAALTMLGKLDTTPAAGPVVVTVFDRARIADYQKMVATLRNAGIRAELYLGNPKNMGNQLKYADRRNSPCVIIQGGDEQAEGVVLLKDLILGAELSKLEGDRDEYLAKQSEAQVKVAEADLVEGVRRILDRHGVKWN